MKNRPWLLYIFMFVLLITAWTVLIVIAVNNQPETVQPEETSAAGSLTGSAQEHWRHG